MDNRSFGVLFGNYLPQDSSWEALADGIVESMDMQHSTRMLSVRIRFAHLVDPSVLFHTEGVIAAALRLQAAVIYPC